MSVVLFGDQFTATTNNTEMCFSIREGNDKFLSEISENKDAIFLQNLAYKRCYRKYKLYHEVLNYLNSEVLKRS